MVWGMARQRVLPPIAELVKLRDQGMTYQAIADKYGVTKGSVHQQFRDAGLTGRGKRYPELVPWRVAEKHSAALPVVMLRLLGRSQKETLDEASQGRVDRFLDWLRADDLVVVYDPDIAMNEASSVGGFAFVKRRHGIDKFPISDPDTPRNDLDRLMGHAPDRCAICDTDEHVGTIAMIEAIDGHRRTLRVPVCVDHSLVLLNAGRKRAGRLGLSWVSGRSS